jgi:O-antigen/teichoic acid export membrane protein
LFWCVNELRGLRRYWCWPERAALKRAFVFAVPLLPGFLIAYCAEWGDYFLIRHFYGEQGVGLFHPAYQYLLILAGLPAALAAVLLPRIAAKHDHDGGAALRHLLVRNAPQFTVLWGAAALFMVALMPAVLGLLLGPSYNSSVAVLQILLIAVPGAVVQHVCGVACFAQGRLGISITGFFGLKSLLNLALSFLLLPLLGVTGSAIGAATSYVLLQWLFVLDQQRLLKTGGAGAGAAVAALLLVQLGGLLLVGVDGLWSRLFLALFGVSFLLAWARHVGLFSRDEVSAIIPPRWQSLEKPLHRLLCPVA